MIVDDPMVRAVLVISVTTTELLAALFVFVMTADAVLVTEGKGAVEVDCPWHSCRLQQNGPLQLYLQHATGIGRTWPKPRW